MTDAECTEGGPRSAKAPWRWRAESRPRAAKEIERDVKRGERSWYGSGSAGEGYFHLPLLPLYAPPKDASYR